MPITVTKQLVLVGIWIAIVLARSGAAQETQRTEEAQEPPTERADPVAQADEAADADEDARGVPCVFTGPRPASDREDPAAAYRERLAELQLLVDVDRDFAEAERGLALLRRRAMGPPAFEGQEEVVVLATERLAEVQLARKAPERARETLTALLERRPGESLAEDEWFEPASEEWIAREEEWLADPKLEGLRKLVAQRIARRGVEAPEVADAPKVDPPTRGSEQELVDAVWRDLQEGDAELVQALGAAAVPALKTLSVMTRDGSYASEVANFRRDPLYWLVGVSPDVALEVILDDLSSTPLTWRKRVARAMARNEILAKDHRTPRGSFLVLREPRWLEVLDRLVTDRRLWEDVGPLLQSQASCSDWTEVQERFVRERLAEGLHEDTWPFPRALWTPTGSRSPVDVPDGPPRFLDVLVDLLHSEDQKLAVWAANRLAATGLMLFLGELEGTPSAAKTVFVRYSKSWRSDILASPRFDAWLDETLQLLRDEDPEVRLAAAEVLTMDDFRDVVPAERLNPLVDDESEAVRLKYFDRVGRPGDVVAPITDQEFHLLRAMLDDPSADVRVHVVVVEQNQDRPTRFTRDELLALARDPSSRVRAQAAWLDVADPSLQAEMLEVLAADEDEDVVQAVDSKLEFVLRQRPETADAFLPVLEARVANEAQPWLRPGDRLPSGVVHRFLEAADLDALHAIVRRLRARPDERGAAAAARWLDFRQRRDLSALAAGLAAWPAEDLAFVLRAAGDLEPAGRNANQPSEPKLEVAKLVEELLARTEPGVADAMRALAGDADANRILRLYAWAWRMKHEAADSADALLAFLEAPLWDDDPWNYREFGRAAQTLGASIDPDRRNAICLRIVESAEVTDMLADLVTDAYLPEREGGVAVSRAMLDRWLTPETTYCRAQEALAHLGPVPGEVEPDLLRHALRMRNVAKTTLHVLAQRKDPRFLPDLRACLNPTWIGYHEERHAFAKEAAFAISQYMDDAAAEVLLEGLRTVETEEIRQACFDALERIRLYQEAQARLNRRAVGKEKRDEAVRELAAMLAGDDSQTVAAAAKGLAALGAVDELPALIRLMQHDDPTVRAAAAEAVERLTAPEPEPRGGAPDEPR